MNITGSISQRFLEISQCCIASTPTPKTLVKIVLIAAVIIGMATLIASDTSLDDILLGASFCSGLASGITIILVFNNSLLNAIALIFARCGRVETAAYLFNGQFAAFINQHTLGLIAFATITCGVATLGLSYLTD
jgi:energy-converting hydrogenase Eha subunit C